MRPPTRVGPTALTAAPATLYLATQPCRLKNLVLTNPTANSIDATIATVPAGQALQTVHHILSGQPVPGHDNYVWPGSRDVDVILTAGDTLQGFGDGLNFQATIQESY